MSGAAKNLVPLLASLPSSRSTSSPPCSPRGDQDGGGCPSSGSTTVSATSSPGLDEEPEQSRITINPTGEMSPRKKPRKQQLTGVELTESRCTEVVMEFFTEDKTRKDITDSKEKSPEKRHVSNVHRDNKSPIQQTELTVRLRPIPSLLGGKHKFFIRFRSTCTRIFMYALCSFQALGKLNGEIVGCIITEDRVTFGHAKREDLRSLNWHNRSMYYKNLMGGKFIIFLHKWKNLRSLRNK